MSSGGHHSTRQTSQDLDQGSGRIRYIFLAHPPTWFEGSDHLPNVDTGWIEGEGDRQLQVGDGPYR